MPIAKFSGLFMFLNRRGHARWKRENLKIHRIPVLLEFLNGGLDFNTVQIVQKGLWAGISDKVENFTAGGISIKVLL